MRIPAFSRLKKRHFRQKIVLQTRRDFDFLLKIFCDSLIGAAAAF
jgi:hypothetical protein